MAFEDLGLSFLPRGGADDPTGPSGNRLEDVLRVLSFRLPRILGARAIAPRALLEGPGSAGDPLGSAIASGVLQQFLRGSPTTTAAGPTASPAPRSYTADPGAPTELQRILEPVYGVGNAPRTPEQLPRPKGPDLNFIPAPEPPASPGPFTNNFDDVAAQLQGRRRPVY